MNIDQLLREQSILLKLVENKMCCLLTAVDAIGMAPPGSGTVTSVTVTTANGISGVVANPTITPAITLTLGAITPTTVNGLTINNTTGTLSITNAKTLSVTQTLTLSGVDSTIMTFPPTSQTIVGLTSTQTLTNKRITSRVQSAASSATLNVDSDSYDMAVLTAQAAALTIANPTGTPTEGQALLYKITDNGTARAITFDTQFRAFGAALPTTTAINKTIYIGCIWNSTDTKWDVFPSNSEI